MISHIGIAVANLEEAIERYRVMTGCDSPHVVEVADQKVRVAIFSDPAATGEHAGTRIELLTPTSPDSPISGFLERKGEGLHHLCIYVDDIEKKLAELKAAGVRLIDETPRVGAEGNRIAFVHPKGTGGVLTELEERSK